MIKIRASWRDGRRGAAAVECALVTPLLVLIVLGAIDVGQFANVAQIVSDASREGARRATRSTVSSEAEVKSAIEGYIADAFPELTADDLNAALTVNVRDSWNAPAPDGDLTTIASGASVSVQVLFQYEPVRWLSGFPGISGKSLEATTVMRRE